MTSLFYSQKTDLAIWTLHAESQLLQCHTLIYEILEQCSWDYNNYHFTMMKNPLDLTIHCILD